MVSSPLKNACQNGNLPQIGVKQISKTTTQIFWQCIMTLIFSIIVTITTITVIITIAACKPKTLPISLEEAATWTLTFSIIRSFHKVSLESRLLPGKSNKKNMYSIDATVLPIISDTLSWLEKLTYKIKINQVANSEFHQSLIETSNKNTSHKQGS